MYQGKGMYQFNSDGGRVEQIRFDGNTLTRRVDEQWTDTLATVEHGVSHCTVESRRASRRCGQRSFKTRIDTFRIGGNSIFKEFRHSSISRRFGPCSVHGIETRCARPAGL
jgi:hypothetical protein